MERENRIGDHHQQFFRETSVSFWLVQENPNLFKKKLHIFTALLSGTQLPI